MHLIDKLGNLKLKASVGSNAGNYFKKLMDKSYKDNMRRKHPDRYHQQEAKDDSDEAEISL